MRKTILLLIFIFFTFAVNAEQGKSTLAILPFTGGNDDEDEGDLIAELFSYDSAIAQTFTIIPQTRIKSIMQKERKIQRSGFTDPDSIFEIGHELSAKYVLSGHLQKLGSINLIVITILDISTFQQIAGDYKEYKNIEEINGFLPEMAKKIVRATKINTKNKPKLAVIPFEKNNNANTEESEILAQLLASEIVNSGKYMVLPRTKSLKTVLAEQKNQRSGASNENDVKEFGNAPNPKFVLSIKTDNLGINKMFTANILNIEDGSQIVGTSQEYTTIRNGISRIKNIAKELLKETISAEDWKHKWVYAGARSGFSSHDYVLNTFEDINAENNFSFEAALQGEVQIMPLLAVQTELLLSSDKIYIADIGYKDLTCTATTLQIPLLAKFTYRPNKFYFAGFAGPYIALPLGQMEINYNDAVNKYDFSTTIGLTGGADAGIKLVGGILFLDARYSGDFLFFKANDAPQYRRKMLSISIGYNYGFINKVYQQGDKNEK
jgi:TolB-like protein